MLPTAQDAASHLGEVSAAVAKAVADPSALETLPLTLAKLTTRFSLRFELTRPTEEIVAKNARQQIAYGWASVTSVNGTPLVDLQSDVIATDEMQKAVHEFMQVRAGDTMHDGRQVAEIVDSLFVTKDLSDAMGWYPGREGWFVGFKVYDGEVWKRFESGELKAFSIAGVADATPFDDDEEL